MTKQIPLTIKSGLPFAKTIEVTLPNGRIWWTDIADFEVLSQIREGTDVESNLLLDLVPFLTVSFDDVNLVTIELVMNGEDTFLLKSSGNYDLIISDIYSVDVRAIPIMSGPVNQSFLVTAPIAGAA